jgi:hypothetical protein
MDLPAVTLDDQQTAAVVLTPTLGGALVDAGVLVERGSYTGTYNTQARVRLVSGVASGVVQASLAGTVVEAGIASPAVGTYVTVPSGTETASVLVDGTAASAAPTTLAAGSDNTLLVSGTPASAQVTLLADDNHLPALGSNVAVRLVNGLSGGTVGLTMTVDFASVAGNVVSGSASPYATVAGDTNMRIEVDSPSTSTPLSLQTGLNIPGGGVYSVFVLGDVAAPVTQLRRDR